MLIVSAHDGYPRWVNSGADFIEIDIRRTAAGAVVLSHDELRPGGHHSTLDEVLDVTRGRVGIQLDLKETGYEVEIVSKAMEKCPTNKLVVTTPFGESIRKVKEAFPEVKAGLTRQFIERNDTADFIALDQRYATEQALSRGIAVWIWTVDDTRLLQKLVNDERVAGIITNRPDLALKLRMARS